MRIEFSLEVEEIALKVLPSSPSGEAEPSNKPKEVGLVTSEDLGDSGMSLVLAFIANKYR